MNGFNNFDEVLKGVKNAVGKVSGTVAEKTVEIKDAAKTKYKIYDLKNDIKKLYFEIGKLTYIAATGGEDNGAELRKMCDTITQKKARIEQLSEGLGDVDFKCPECGKPTSGANNNCPNCGADMTVDISAEIAEI